MEREKTVVYRCLPCPLYDVEGLESWLDDLARSGLMLVGNSLSRGRAAFRPGAPCPVRYRLTAGACPPPVLTPETLGRPLTEEESAEYAWRGAGMLGEYKVYRAMDRRERRPNADPAVHRLAMNRAKQRLLFDGGVAAAYLLAFPLWLLAGGTPLNSLVRAGTWLSLSGASLTLWLLLDSALSCAALARAPTRHNPALPACRRDWRREAPRYYARAGGQLAAAVIFLLLATAHWAVLATGAGEVPLSDNQDPPPFATLAQLCDGEVDVYEATLPAYSTTRAWSDPLCPHSVDWRETARVTLDSGALVEGGLYVDYHEAAGPILAQSLAEELVSHDRRDRNCSDLENLELDADYLAAYNIDGRFPTIVFRRGNVTVRAMFYQTSSYQVPLAYWAEEMVGSVTKIVP